jgi:hypothetical protein
VSRGKGAIRAVTNAISKLLEISSEPLSATAPLLLNEAAGSLQETHASLLGQKNGFFAFESALRVFPSEPSAASYSLSEWNSPGLWKGTYGDLVGEAVCFAEDAFGGQFCFAQGAVCTSDPETGGIKRMASDLEEWARLLLDDYAYLTGHPLMHQWQVANGPLEWRKRLMPRTPFVCGGAFDIENLVAVEAAEAMGFRGEFATQIRDLPDGTKIRFRFVD